MNKLYQLLSQTLPEEIGKDRYQRVLRYNKFSPQPLPVPAQSRAFEEEMLRRTTVKVEASAEAAEFIHSPDAFQEGNVTRGAMARSVNGCEEDNT